MSRSLVFKVKRSEPELIIPASPTPYEIKQLSDLDNQQGFRFQIPVIQFYRHVIGMEDKDPAKVVKEAIAKALVYYYPFAGRLREGPDHKLMVDCTGEGVMFIEADADVKLNQFGDVLQPPFPGLEDLLYNGPGSGCVLDSPLLLIQVTRLLCGGFILSIRLNHTMSDAVGFLQFMTALGEMARGGSVPSIPPVWKREVLKARDPSPATLVSHLYYEPEETNNTMLEDVVFTSRPFFISQQQVAGLRNHLPTDLCHNYTRFEVLAACLWRCRTIALGLNPSHKAGLVCAVNARPKFNPPLPVGYYGNALGFPLALAPAGKLCQNPLGYALELVKKSKEDVTEESLRSFIDLMEKKGTPSFSPAWYIVSDITRIGFRDVDFGWGKAVYGGPTWADPSGSSLILSSRNSNGDEDGVVVTINLPALAMEKFTIEIEKMIREPISPSPVGRFHGD